MSRNRSGAPSRDTQTMLDAASTEFEVAPGRPLPLGVSETRHGFNFAVFSRHATAITLVLYASGQHDPLIEFPLDATFNRTGDVWHTEIRGLNASVRYGWRADRQPLAQDRFHCFDGSLVLIDPYARAITGGSRWGAVYTRTGQAENANGAERRSLYVHDEFDWESVRPPCIPLPDKVIYEAHVRGLTQHESSGAKHAGTYLGLIEKIPYFRELGVTTIELLPVYEFDENELTRVDPTTGQPLKNFWGYSPIGFFAPKAAYASTGRDGEQVREFKQMVRELHRAGLEVILDVVFNHTGEGTDRTMSFRGLDNRTYYMLDPATGEYLNYSGCGNTLNCNHPVVRDLIIDALRYWVLEMHIDGFRFDLASILGRGQHGEVLANPPLLERIAGDPVLANVTLIAEAWDAAGLYQVGSFAAGDRWAEWNGPFRDDVRRFVRGDAGFTSQLATRLAGSSDLFDHSGRRPCHSINFITCHDGFTLADLVAYDRKHNQANGENDGDGSDANFSSNGGTEGPTSDPAVIALRHRQQLNFLTLLLLAQGTPMLLAGDEFSRTQRGNNNAYCQDNEIGWIDWRLLEQHRDLFRFAKMLIAFRRAHAVLRRTEFLTGEGTVAHPRPDVAWHGVHLDKPDWGDASCALAMHLAGEHATPADCDIYLACNAWRDALTFELPPPPAGQHWVRVIDTAQPSPADIAEPGQEFRLDTTNGYLVNARTCVVLRSR